MQSYPVAFEFGITRCRRVWQDEAYELVEHLMVALKEIEALSAADLSADGARARNAGSLLLPRRHGWVPAR